MSLAQRSVRSSAYNVLSSVLQTGVSFVRSILLFRLLTPDDFGLYSLVSAIIIFSGSLPNFGMDGALVHRAPESEGETGLRVHFTLNLAFNILWAAVMLALAWALIADHATRAVFLVVLATQVIDNITRTGRFKLTRQVAFRRLAVIQFLITLVGAVTAVLLAYAGYGVWSLVSTDIVAAALLLTGIYLIRPVWRPRLGWSPARVRYFLDYGRRAFLNVPLMQALNKVDDIWTGFFLGQTALGFYSRAYRLAAYPGSILAAPLNQVAAATYAELKEQTHQLGLAFNQVNGFLIRSGFLLGGWLTLIAPEFVLIVASETWLPMVAAFRLMLVFTLLDPLRMTVAGLFGAVGRPEIYVRVQLLQLGVLIAGLFVLGSPWGIEGVALAVDLMMLAGIVVLLWQARKYVQFSLSGLFGVPTLALLVALLPPWLLFGDTLTGGQVWQSALIKSGLYALLFAAVMLLFERRQLLASFQFVRRSLFGPAAPIVGDPAGAAEPGEPITPVEPDHTP